ncbi:MAG: class F sortase [Actinomycetota bacterium]
MVLEAARRALAREDAMSFGSGVGVVMLVTLMLLVGTAQPMSVRASRRVVVDEVRVLSAEPIRRPPAAPVAARTPDCPQLDNPGGLRWRPSADAGPWPTGGTVRLPKLGVSAPIFRVGVDTRSEMVVPRNAQDVAWLDQGPFPGDTQNAVLAGHIRWSGVPGSFGRIQQMSPGDIVVVELNGKKWEFRVQWTCLFDYDTDLAAKIMGYTDAPSVTLISCGGVYSPAAGTHNKRVAVRGELIRST